MNQNCKIWRAWEKNGTLRDSFNVSDFWKSKSNFVGGLCCWSAFRMLWFIYLKMSFGWKQGYH